MANLNDLIRFIEKDEAIFTLDPNICPEWEFDIYRFRSRLGRNWIEWYSVDRRNARVKGPSGLPYHMTARTKTELLPELESMYTVMYDKREALQHLRRIPERDYVG